MMIDIALNEKGIELCREIIKKACSTKKGAKQMAIVMEEFGFKTIEDVLIVLFSEDAFNDKKQNKKH